MTLRIMDTDMLLLKVLADYRLLTAKQAGYILERNLRALQRRLDALVGTGLVEHVDNMTLRSASSTSGHPGFLFGLAEAGARLLVERDVLSQHIAPKLVNGESLIHQFDHQRLINMFRLSLVEMSRNKPEFKIRGISSNSPFVVDPDSGHPSTRASVQLGTGTEARHLFFIPDYVFQVQHEARKESLLFFLEADTGSEPHSSTLPEKPSITKKILFYQVYFQSKIYKSYESRWKQTYRGFRLLFLCADAKRARAVAKTVRANLPSDFVWVTDLERLASEGISGQIWLRGGKYEASRSSMLGSLGFRSPSLTL